MKFISHITDKKLTISSFDQFKMDNTESSNDDYDVTSVASESVVVVDDSLQTLANQLSIINLNYQSNLSRLEEELKKAKEQNAKLVEKNRELVDQKDQLDCLKLNEKLKEKEELVEELHKLFVKYMDKSKEHEETIKQLKEENTHLDEELTRVTDVYIILKEDKAHICDKHDKLMEENKSLKLEVLESPKVKELNLANEKNKKLEEEIKQYKDQMAKTEDSLSVARVVLQKYRLQCQKYEEHVRYLELKIQTGELYALTNYVPDIYRKYYQMKY